MELEQLRKAVMAVKNEAELCALLSKSDLIVCEGASIQPLLSTIYVAVLKFSPPNDFTLGMVASFLLRLPARLTDTRLSDSAQHSSPQRHQEVMTDITNFLNQAPNVDRKGSPFGEKLLGLAQQPRTELKQGYDQQWTSIEHARRCLFEYNFTESVSRPTLGGMFMIKPSRAAAPEVSVSGPTNDK